MLHSLRGYARTVAALSTGLSQPRTVVRPRWALQSQRAKASFFQGLYGGCLAVVEEKTRMGVACGGGRRRGLARLAAGRVVVMWSVNGWRAMRPCCGRRCCVAAGFLELCVLLVCYACYAAVYVALPQDTSIRRYVYTHSYSCHDRDCYSCVW